MATVQNGYLQRERSRGEQKGLSRDTFVIPPDGVVKIGDIKHQQPGMKFRLKVEPVEEPLPAME